MRTTTELCTLDKVNTTDVDLFLKWLWEARHIVSFDPDTLTYPRVIMAKATKEGKPTMFVPIQPVLMVESLAADPTSSVGGKAEALVSIGDALVQIMKDTGIAETYFLCEDSLAEFAIRRGWTEMKGFRMMRRKITKEERQAWIPKQEKESKDAN